jgi:hypothetical protein
MTGGRLGVASRRMPVITQDDGFDPLVGAADFALIRV